MYVWDFIVIKNCDQTVHKLNEANKQNEELQIVEQPLT